MPHSGIHCSSSKPTAFSSPPALSEQSRLTLGHRPSIPALRSSASSLASLSLSARRPCLCLYAASAALAELLYPLSRRGPGRRALRVGMFLALASAFSCWLPVTLHARDLLEMSGVVFQAPLLGALCHILAALAVVLGLVLVDHAGRRPLLLSGLTGMAALALCLALLCTTHPPERDGSEDAAMQWKVLSLFGFVVFGHAGLATAAPLAAMELFPQGARAPGIALCFAVFEATQILMSLFFLRVVAAVGVAGTFYVGSAVSALTALILYGALPETMSLPIQDLEDAWAAWHRSRGGMIVAPKVIDSYILTYV